MPSWFWPEGDFLYLSLCLAFTKVLSGSLVRGNIQNSCPSCWAISGINHGPGHCAQMWVCSHDGAMVMTCWTGLLDITSYTRWYQEIRTVVMSMASVYNTRHRHDDDTNFLIPPRIAPFVTCIKSHRLHVFSASQNSLMWCNQGRTGKPRNMWCDQGRTGKPWTLT